MNKTVIAVLLLGLVVVALAGEAKDKSAKLEKMRMKKGKLMAKKEKMHLDKVKKGMREGAIPTDKRQGLAEKDAFRQKYEAMKEQAKAGALTPEQFKEQMRRLKDEAKRAKAEGKSEASRNKRSAGIKKSARKMKDAYKSKTAEKKRRSP